MIERINVGEPPFNKVWFDAAGIESFMKKIYDSSNYSVLSPYYIS